MPGDEPCAFDGRRLACGATTTAAPKTNARDLPAAEIDEPLFADIDGDGRDNLCGVAPDAAGLVLCESSVAPFAKRRFDLRALRVPGDLVRSADLDGLGRDAFCLVRGDVLLCDTGRDGGLAEVVVRLDRAGIVLLGDVDGDSETTTPASSNSSVVRCDTDHDGSTGEQKIPSAWVAANDTRVLAGRQRRRSRSICALGRAESPTTGDGAATGP